MGRRGRQRPCESNPPLVWMGGVTASTRLKNNSGGAIPKKYDFFENVFRPKIGLYGVIWGAVTRHLYFIWVPDRLGWVPVDFEKSFFAVLKVVIFPP